MDLIEHFYHDGINHYYLGEIVGNRLGQKTFDMLMKSHTFRKAWEDVKKKFPLELVHHITIKIAPEYLDRIYSEVLKSYKEKLERSFFLGCKIKIEKDKKKASVEVVDFLGYDKIVERVGEIERTKTGYNTTKPKTLAEKLSTKDILYSMCHTHPEGDGIPSPLDFGQHRLGQIDFVATIDGDILILTPYRHCCTNRTKQGFLKEMAKQFKFIVKAKKKQVEQAEGVLIYNV